LKDSLEMPIFDSNKVENSFQNFSKILFSRLEIFDISKIQDFSDLTLDKVILYQ